MNQNQTHYQDELKACVELCSKRELPTPAAMIVAGSGLSVDVGSVIAEVPFAELLPFPVQAIQGHNLVAQWVEGPAGVVLHFRGRIHAYQGFSPAQVCWCVRLGALLGAQTLLVSNAAGCLDEGSRPGQLFLIRDQINLTALNPLTGSPAPEWGPRFPDMSEAYSKELRRSALEEARSLGLELREGVYAGLLGPSYETPAEIRMLRSYGADLVGMSTVLEVIAARHLGVRCLGISLATNMAAGVGEGGLNHEEVLEAGRGAARDVARLLESLISSSDFIGVPK